MKKGMTLVETLVALCVSSMLLMGLGTSFYMFRVSNKDTLEDAKNEQYMLAVKDYVRNNADEIVRSQLGNVYFKANVKTLNKINEDGSEGSENNYWLFQFDKKFYIANSPNYFGSGVSGIDIGKISVRDAVTGEPIKTVNGEFIVGFQIPDYYLSNAEGFNEVPFFLEGYENSGTIISYAYEEEDDDEDKQEDYETDVLLKKLDLAESLYFSGMYKNPDLFEPDKFNYEDKTLYMNTNRFVEYTDPETGEVSTQTERIIALSNLPFDAGSVSVTCSLDTQRYQLVSKIDPDTYEVVTGEDGKEIVESIPIYGVETGVNNSDYGVAYVEASSPNGQMATLLARECFRIGIEAPEDLHKMTKDDIDDFFTEYGFSNVNYEYEESDEVFEGYVISLSNTDLLNPDDEITVVISEGPGPEGEDLPEEDDHDDDDDESVQLRFYSHHFVGWFREDDMGSPVSTDHEFSISVPRQGDYVKYIAVFEDEEKPIEVIDKYLIEERLRYTVSSKTIFFVKCTVNYKIDGIERNETFVVKEYEMYLPELFTLTVEEG